MFEMFFPFGHFESDLLRAEFIDIPYQTSEECNKFTLLGSLTSHLELPFWTSLLASF